MIRYGAAIAIAGILLVLIPVSSPLPAQIGLMITGLGCAPIYPAIIHATPAHFGAEYSQAIIGIQWHVPMWEQPLCHHCLVYWQGRLELAVIRFTYCCLLF